MMPSITGGRGLALEIEFYTLELDYLLKQMTNMYCYELYGFSIKYSSLGTNDF